MVAGKIIKKQPDVRGTRSVVVKNMASPEKHQRVHSEPATLHHSSLPLFEDHGRQETRSLMLLSKPRDVMLIDNTAQPNTFDDPSINSSLGGDAIAAIDEGFLDFPTYWRPKTRVVQRMVLPNKPGSKGQKLESQVHAGDEEDLAHQIMATFTDQEVRPSSSQRANMPDSGPGPGKQSPALLLEQGDLTLQRQQAAIDLHKQWHNVRKLRTHVCDLRSEVRYRRQELRTKQQTKSVAEDRLLRHMMKYIHLQNTDQRSIEQEESMSLLAQECQRARDEYGPLEDDFILLEDELDRDEFNLMELEDPLYEQIYLQDIQARTEEFDLPSTVSDPSIASECGEFSGERYHPLVMEFLSKMGDVDILQERLADRRDDRYSLESGKEFRQRIGLTLAPDDQRWLDEYDAAEAKLLEELRFAEAEAEKLRKQCFDYGLVDEMGDPTSVESWERQVLDEEGDMDEFTRFPDLLPRHKTTEIHLKDPDPETDRSLDDTDNRINRWLLIHLRSSPLDVSLLARTYESLFGPIKFRDDWQKDVMNLWYKDGTRRGVHAYRIYSSDGSSQIPPVLPEVDIGDEELRTDTAFLSQVPTGNS